MNRIFFVDGKFVDENKAVIPVTAHALHYGTGVFEGIRAYYNEKEKCLCVFRMREHFERLKNSAKILFINIPFTVEQLIDVTSDLLRKNYVETNIYIRPLAFKSDPAVGQFNLQHLKDSLVIYTVPIGKHLKDADTGVSVMVSSWRRVSDNSIPPRGKITGAYVNTALAKTESELNGYGEALLLDDRGHIVEGSAENIFLVNGGKVYTPPVSDDILVGITRDTIIKICKEELGLEVIERSIDRSEVYCVDELFLVGTGAEVSPVIEVDKRKIGDGRIGEISMKIKKIYFKMVYGEMKGYEKFVTKIKK